MSLDMESKMRKFYASGQQIVHRINTLEISHSFMTKTYYLWSEPYPGQFTDALGNVRITEPVNFKVKPAGTEQHLDQVYDIHLDTTDIEDEFREQMRLVPIDTLEYVRYVFREFMSDDMTDPMSEAVLQMESVSYKRGSASIKAVVPRLNITRTGEVYAPRIIPMLREFM